MSEPVIQPAAFRYADGKAPAGYRCANCFAQGCKLWRRSNTCLEAIELLCVECAGENQKQDVSDIDVDGRHTSSIISNHRTDQIGWFVPAVPTEDGEAFWGYTSVPDDGVAWWRALPSRPDAIMQLCGALDAAGAKVTFDSGRDITKACTFCGTKDEPRELVDIGRYFNGDMLTRPVCARCKTVAEARGKP